MPTSNDASYDSVVRYAVPARESAMSVKIYVTTMLLPISNDATAHRGRAGVSSVAGTRMRNDPGRARAGTARALERTVGRKARPDKDPIGITPE